MANRGHPRVAGVLAALLAGLALASCGAATDLKDERIAGQPINNSNDSDGAGSSGGSRGGNSGGSGSVSGMCGQYFDDEGWSVALVIRNDTAQVLHVGVEEASCGLEPLFEVRDTSSSSPIAEPAFCRSPCQSVIQGGLAGCPGVCLFPNAITLQPFEATTLLWHGLYTTAVDLPQQCLPDGHRGSSGCDQARQINPGTFTFQAWAGTSLDCSFGLGECPPCEFDGNGGCKTSGAVIVGEIYSAETTVQLDASYGVGDLAGGDGDFGPTRAVELVFTD